MCEVFPNCEQPGLNDLQDFADAKSCAEKQTATCNNTLPFCFEGGWHAARTPVVILPAIQYAGR